MVADEKQIQVFGFAEDCSPFHVVTYNVDQENSDNFAEGGIFRQNSVE